MYKLENDQLQVSILDPVADQERFGTRYCTGGYIFQITDSKQGDLLSGPTYPESFDWFNGQGIPDAFNLSPLREPASAEPTALIIGIGLCDLKENRVLEFCRWEVEERPAEIVMRTTSSYQGFGFELQRAIHLHQRSVHSASHLRNTGNRPIPVRWFPHPFYPQPDTDELCRFNLPVSFPENPGYALGESGFIVRKGWPWEKGHYQALDHAAQTHLVVLQRHPLLGLVAATCSYVPGFFPIWGNLHTFSWEPFFERTLAPGQEVAWWIDYDF
ncbi:MAG: hypothetical protein H5T69_09865 [Chloroflexi bacterium]|nr:hypothetical protein [Chloroflexota bacterium]